MTFTALQILWYFLIFLLIGGYFVLDGFDLGVGVLSPFLSVQTTTGKLPPMMLYSTSAPLMKRVSMCGRVTVRLWTA